jgi:FkbM family methyltransferase
MHPLLKRTLKRTGQLLGLDVRWHVRRPPHDLSTLLDLYRVDAIFDVGANEGTSGEYFRSIGFRHRLVSFEPVAEYYRRLEEKARKDPLWWCEQAAIGATEGELSLTVSGPRGITSSFLPMTDAMRRNARDLDRIGTETVTVKTIDGVIDRYYPEGDRLFLKLDVQGYEARVLEGARRSLPRVVGMKIEMSLIENYEGETLVHDMLPSLYALGFRLTGLEIAWPDPDTQEIFQVDGLLFRTDRL